MCPIIALVEKAKPRGTTPPLLPRGTTKGEGTMTDHSREHLGWRRQLLLMAAVVLGATLLVVGFLPPQVARGQEQQPEQIPTPPQVAQGQQQQQQQQDHVVPSAQGNEEAQNQEQRVLDKDPQGNEYVAGELLVSYKKGASKKAKEEAPKKVGAKVKKDFSAIGVQHVSVPEVKNEQAREARQKALELKKKVLEQVPDVKAVDYNYVREGTMTPNDPLYNSQWFGNTQWGFPKISAPQAWDYTQGSSNVRIAILDSGIDMNHPDLKGKVVAQYDYVNNDYDATDDRGHGTHVAGTAAARTNNKDAAGYVGVAGTCPNCSLINAKVLDANNSYANDVGIIYAIHFAVYHKAKVINMSFGGTGRSAALESALDYAWNNGAVLVGAAGNKGFDGTEFYPAAYKNVIAVAATDKDDKRAIYPNEPAPSYYYDSSTKTYVGASNAGPWVDVAAPGKDILSTTPTYASACNCYQKNYDGKFYGTSMAAPHVSGLAGLIFSKDGLISNAQVRNEIESRAQDLGTTGKDDVFGHGRINAHASVYLMKPTTYQQDSPKIAYGSSSDWQTYHWSDYQGTYTDTNWASRSGATAKLSFMGNSVTWWANRGTYGGKARVYVDGVQQDADPSLTGIQPVDLYAGRNEPTQPVFSKTWGSTHGSHTIEIVVEGTSGRPWVDVDAFTVVQPNYCYAMSC
jgi:thermitase